MSDSSSVSTTDSEPEEDEAERDGGERAGYSGEKCWMRVTPKEGEGGEDSVSALLEGMSLTNKDLMMLEGENCVMRRDHRTMGKKVKVIAGGRAGLGNLFAGYVGPGLLAAAVHGSDAASSPTPRAVLALVRQMALDHTAGILLLVLNYLEDRVSFGLAMERARNEKVNIDMVVVADNCWQKIYGPVGKKGLTGIVLMMKIAGAMAEKGERLEVIREECRSLCGLQMVSLSAQVEKERILLGCGFDRDLTDGVYPLDTPLEVLVERMFHYALRPDAYFSLSLDPESRIILLVNCFDDDHVLLYSAVKTCVRTLQDMELPLIRVYAGNFVSDRPGFSLTCLLDRDDRWCSLLDFPSGVKVWPRSYGLGQILAQKPVLTAPVIVHPIGPFFDYAAWRLAVGSLNLIIRKLIRNREKFDRLDPLNIYGTKMAKGAMLLKERLNSGELNRETAFQFLNDVSKTLEEGVSGMDGTLYGIFLAGVSQEFVRFSRVYNLTREMWTAGFCRGVASVKVYTGHKQGDGSFQDVLGPIREHLKKPVWENEVGYFAECIALGEMGARGTKDKKLGVECECCLVWLETLFEAYRQWRIPDPTSEREETSA